LLSIFLIFRVFWALFPHIALFPLIPILESLIFLSARWQGSLILIAAVLIVFCRGYLKHLVHSEILKNEIYREEIKLKIKDASEKDSLLQTKESERLVAEPVQTKIKGHASSPSYGKNEPSPDPTSTAKTFHPGSWIPPDSSSHNK
uniref:NADH:ubiquinone oxidoreductase complex assembly factor 2 n=1 Tax=Chelydra serpentina TaxID=8475 RepID=A0A8C3SEU6_CHESE